MCNLLLTSLSVSEKDTLLQRNKILSNLVEELKSDVETIQNEVTTKNREREHEKSIATFLMTLKTKMRKYLC